jgi:hypothetical protein
MEVDRKAGKFAKAGRKPKIGSLADPISLAEPGIAGAAVATRHGAGRAAPCSSISTSHSSWRIACDLALIHGTRELGLGAASNNSGRPFDACYPNVQHLGGLFLRRCLN